MTTSVRELLRAGEAPDPLGGHPTDAHPGVSGKAEAEDASAADAQVLATWQERLYAERRRALLVVLQGMDTSGKGGVIKKVIGAVNPQGCRITAFKKPTEDEAAHDFLWRIERALPAAGHIGIFDRSHYEDVVITRVHSLISEEEWQRRHESIRAFEANLVAENITVVKFFLHISYDEQRERLLARLDDPTKRWKFREGDIDERAHWKAYQELYGEAIRRHDTTDAPWYVIPADRKWYRNWAITRILVETFEEVSPEYPRPDLDVEALKARLAPPN